MTSRAGRIVVVAMLSTLLVLLLVIFFYNGYDVIRFSHRLDGGP